MENFFSPTSTQEFEMFSASHLAAIAAALLMAVLLFIFQKNFQGSPRLFQAIRWSLFAILLGCELIYHSWAVSVDIWSFNSYAPLHLSGIGSITAMIGLLTLNRVWIQISFFIGLVPAFLTLLTPDLSYGYTHLRFWIFFLEHIAIFLASLFLALNRPNVITIKSIVGVYSLLILYAIVIGYLINPALNSNFMYLEEKPGSDTLLDFFGEGIWYYLSLGLTALAVFILQYFIWSHFVMKKSKKTAREEQNH